MLGSLNHLNGLSSMGDVAEMHGARTMGDWTDAFSSVVKTSTTAFKDIMGRQTQQIQNQPPLPQPQAGGTDWNKILLYGGLAVGAVALVMYLKKRRS